MSCLERSHTQAALLTDKIRLLCEEQKAEKRDQVASFQQRQSELEIKIRTIKKELRTLIKELRTLEQNHEAAIKEVEQKYKPELDELVWSFIQFHVCLACGVRIPFFPSI